MKTPIKPQRPDKPRPPNKDQKYHKHSIGAEKLFFSTKYWDGDGNEISAEQYQNGIEDELEEDDCHSYDKEDEELTPSIKALLELVTSGINLDNVFIDLELGYDSGRNYDCRPYQGISVYYTTPFEYNKELEEYNLQYKKYEVALISYNEKLNQYKKDMEEYKKFKAKVNLDKKKIALENQLAELKAKL